MSIEDQTVQPNGAEKTKPSTPKVSAQRRKKVVQPKRAQIGSDDLPRRTLKEALRVPTAIKNNYGKQATWDQIATGMDMSPQKVAD